MDKSKSCSVQDIIAKLSKEGEGLLPPRTPGEDGGFPSLRRKLPIIKPKPKKEGSSDARDGRTEKTFPPITHHDGNVPRPVMPRQREVSTGPQRVSTPDYLRQTSESEDGGFPSLRRKLPRTKPKPKKEGSSDARDGKHILKVTGFSKNVTEEAMKLHFENQKKSGGGPVDSVSIIDGTAVVHFKHASDAQNVLCKEQTLQGQCLTVDQLDIPGDQAQTMFVLSGVNKGTHHETIKDFLESKLENCSVLSVNSYSKQGMVLVVFADSSCPELSELQTMCDRNPLENSTLHVDVYEDNVETEMFNFTKGRLRFVQKHNIVDEIRKLNITAVLDESCYSVTLEGKTSVMPEARKRFTDILQNEFRLDMPGIVSFLASWEAKQWITMIEDEKGCIIEVNDNIYAVLQDLGDKNSSTDTGYTGSGGSDTSTSYIFGKSVYQCIHGVLLNQTDIQKQPGRSKNTVKDEAVMGEFKIGKCHFVMKTGKFKTEDSDCMVNITQSDIREGDIWKALTERTKDEILSQWMFPRNQTDWFKNGVVFTAVTGLPCRFILHISQKHFKGDPVKTVVKFLNSANEVRDVKSVSFFTLPCAGTKASSMGDPPCLLVEAINKFQKSDNCFVTSIRLVLNNMDPGLVATVKNEVLKLRVETQRKVGFFNSTFGLVGKTKPKTPGRPTIEIISSSPMSTVPDEKEPLSKDMEDTEEDCRKLLKSEIEVYICSYNTARNREAFDKLREFCQVMMTPEEVVDERIKQMTAKDIKQVLSRLVKVDVDTENRRVMMQGFTEDVKDVSTKLSRVLDRMSVPGNSSSSRTDIEAGGVSMDSDDVFRTLVVNHLRTISDEKKKGQAKLDILKILFDAQS